MSPRRPAADAADHADGPRHRRLVGRYRLDSELGRGAMGTVWAAYDEVLHRPVAVKEVRLSSVPLGERAVVRERTLREARATAMLSHPNVVTLYDVVEVASDPYVVMELLPSRSLAAHIADHGSLTQSETAEIGSAVASALITAHRAGITHRDVKPGNVLIGSDGQIKLTDFGIARNAAESSMTQTGTVLGSPPYIAPEVAMGRAVGPAADLWGLGATLFACLEGRPPYDGGNPVSTVSAVVHGDVPVPQGRGPVVDVVRGLMVKDPGLRMPLQAVRRRLRPLLADPEDPLLTIPGPGAPASPSTAEFALPPSGPTTGGDDPDPDAGLVPVAREAEGAEAAEPEADSADSADSLEPTPTPTPTRGDPSVDKSDEGGPSRADGAADPVGVVDPSRGVPSVDKDDEGDPSRTTDAAPHEAETEATETEADEATGADRPAEPDGPPESGAPPTTSDAADAAPDEHAPEEGAPEIEPVEVGPTAAVAADPDPGPESDGGAATEDAEVAGDTEVDEPDDDDAPAAPDAPGEAADEDGPGDGSASSDRTTVTPVTAAETTMVSPRVPLDGPTRAVRPRTPARPAGPRGGGRPGAPPTPAVPWAAASRAPHRAGPGAPAAAPAPAGQAPAGQAGAGQAANQTSASQALAADPGPLPFTPRSPARTSQVPTRALVVGLVVLLAVLATGAAVGAYALTRTLGGQPALGVALAPVGPRVDGVVLVDHVDGNDRYSGTGLGFTALTPVGWQQFRLQQTGGDVAVRFVSPDASREIRVDRIVGFFPDQQVRSYAALLADTSRLGVDAVTTNPLVAVGPARAGASEPVQQMVYRTRSGASDDRMTWTRLVPTARDLWVVRLTAPSADPGGAADQFTAVANSFVPPA